MKKVSEADRAEVEALRARCLLMIDFFENAQDFKHAAMYRANVERVAATGSARRMRLLARDFDEMTIGLAPHERDGLEALLEAKLGVNKDAERAAQRKQVAVALARGTVASEKERRRLEDYAEMLEATGEDPAQLEAVRRLLRAS